MREYDVNPIIKSDFPDPDVIRVEDTYYMVSTTMHFLPGGVILRSYDLVNWEIVNYVFDELDGTEGERLERESTMYGCGMWAPSFRYHNGKFYVAFVNRNVRKTYIYSTDDVMGKWDRKVIEEGFHDLSLFFDDDDRVYVIYGNTDIYIKELEPDLSGVKEDGLSRLIISDVKGQGLGFEGSHFYKINNRYYLFMIHWLQTGNARRTECCYVCDSLTGEFKGKDVLDDDMDFFNKGVAQGGIVDTPAGKWFAVLFRDNGAVGRIPVLVPVTFKNDYPVFGVNGKVPDNLDIASSRPYYRYEKVYTSDDFMYDVTKTSHPKLKLQWQWNHKPDASLWKILPEGGLQIRTNKICANVTHAKNMLTQRCMYPRCEAKVTIDASDLNEGDVAGLCLLQGEYGFLGILKDTGDYFLVKIAKASSKSKVGMNTNDYLPGALIDKIRLNGPVVSLCLKASFEDLTDKLDFFYEKNGRWTKVGTPHNLVFKLDHFCGARFGLFVYSTKETGGSAVFTNFDYSYNT